MNSTVGVTPFRNSQFGSLLPGKTQDSPFLSAQSLQQLDAENVGELVPDINNVAVHFEDPPDVDDLLAVTSVRPTHPNLPTHPPTHPPTHTCTCAPNSTVSS